MEHCAISIVYRTTINITDGSKLGTSYIPRKHRYKACVYSEEITFFFVYSMQIHHMTIPKSDI